MPNKSHYTELLWQTNPNSHLLAYYTNIDYPILLNIYLLVIKYNARHLRKKSWKNRANVR